MRIKFVGLLLALGTIAYKVYIFTSYQRQILAWWGGLIVLYFLMYSTSALTVFAACAKDSTATLMSIIMAVFCALLLAGDFISWLGFMVTLNDMPMSHMGITPICNVVLLVANLSILIECRIRGKKAKPAAA